MSNVFVFKPNAEPQTTTFVFGEVREPIEATVDMYAGESVVVDLLVPIVAEVYNGSVLESVLTYSEQYNISTSIYSGEDVAYQLARFVRFVTDTYDGAYVYTDVKYNQVMAETYTAYDGHYTEAQLSHNISLQVFASDGSYCESNILTPESYKIIAEIYGGSVYEVDSMSVSINIQPTVYSGSELSSTLTSYQNYVVDVYDGHDLTVELTVPQTSYIDCEAYDGEYLDTSVSMQISYSLEHYHGESVYVDVDVSPQEQILVEFYDGSVVETTLDTVTVMSTVFYSGSVLEAVVEDVSPFSITADVSAGQYCSTDDLYYDFGLGGFISHTGEHALVSELNEVPNNNQYSGETVDVDLSLSANLTTEVYEGGSLSSVLSYYESAPVGTFTINYGEHLQTNINTLRTVTFTCRMSHDIGFVVDRWKSLDVMLGTKCCHKQNKHSQLIVDLSSKPDTDLYVGNAIDGVRFECDLSVVRLFDFNISHSSHFDVSADLTDSYSVGHGSALAVNMYTEPVIHLSSGSLSYSGNIVYELVRTLPAIVTSYTISDGSVYKVNSISMHYQYTINTYHGESLAVNLSVYDAIRFNMFDGQTIEAKLQSQAALQFDMSHGSDCEATFYDEPYTFTAGEHLVVESLDTDYEVEFLEVGLLDNTYVRVDSDGVPIDIDTTEMSIEGELYNRFIKGRCY